MKGQTHIYSYILYTVPNSSFYILHTFQLVVLLVTGIITSHFITKVPHLSYISFERHIRQKNWTI